MTVIVRHPSNIEPEATTLDPAVDGTIPMHRKVFRSHTDGPASMDVGCTEYKGPRVGGPVVYPGYVELCYLPKGEHYQLTASGQLVHVRQGSFAIRLEGSTSWVITPKELGSLCFFSPGRPDVPSVRGRVTDVPVLTDPLFIHPEDLAEFDDPDAQSPGTVRSREILTIEDTAQMSARWSELEPGAALHGAASAADRMIYLVDGELTLETGGERIEVAQGSYVNWPAGDSCILTAPDGGATLFIVTSPAGAAS
jgi:quercetin dioxygenase-like cupin family protein